MCLFKCNPVSLSTCAPFPCICKCLSNLYVCLNPPKKERKKETCLPRTPVQIVELLHFIDRLWTLFVPVWGPVFVFQPLCTAHWDTRRSILENGIVILFAPPANSAKKTNFFSTSKAANSPNRFFAAIGAHSKFALSLTSGGVHIWPTANQPTNL